MGVRETLSGMSRTRPEGQRAGDLSVQGVPPTGPTGRGVSCRPALACGTPFILGDPFILGALTPSTALSLSRTKGPETRRPSSPS